MNHPDPDKLMDYLYDELDAEQWASVVRRAALGGGRGDFPGIRFCARQADGTTDRHQGVARRDRQRSTRPGSERLGD